MEWIEHGYALLWATVSSLTREMRNAASAMEHQEFVSDA